MVNFGIRGKTLVLVYSLLHHEQNGKNCITIALTVWKFQYLITEIYISQNISLSALFLIIVCGFKGYMYAAHTAHIQ